MSNDYRNVRAVDGLECDAGGHFRYKGKEKKVIYVRTNFGNGRATARLIFMRQGKIHYIQAAKAVAMAWKFGYDEEKDCIIYKDGNIHNIAADNLEIVTPERYTQYQLRNSGYNADDVEERKRKLQLVIDEAGMTKHYLETLDMEPINRHVKEYLYMCLMSYTKETLHIGERTALYIVSECLARMYECIMNGMCLYNYERYCKKMLLNYKKKGNFGFTGCVPKPIEIKVQQLNLDCLWERYKQAKTNK